MVLELGVVWCEALMWSRALRMASVGVLYESVLKWALNVGLMLLRVVARMMSWLHSDILCPALGGECLNFCPD
jgi:hypothetical protein